MRYFTFLLFSIFTSSLFSQPATADTTIYPVAEIMPMPLMKGCRYDGNLDSARQCAEQKFMGLLAQNVRYPADAQKNNIQGMVVTQFVVELDGQISQIKILRDIGGGCGDEAVRVLKAFNEAGARWLPGKQGEKYIRTQITLPVRFKLEEAKPYYIVSGDTIFTQVSEAAGFRGGVDSLAKYVLNHTIYPPDFRDSCKTGIVEMSLVLYPNGKVKIDNQLDFNNLGDDFQFNAIRLANRTTGLWQAAKFEGKSVTTTFPLRVVYKSDAKTCKTVNENFDKAILLAAEAMSLEEGKDDEAIQKLSEALVLHPNNTEFLYYRGNIFIGQNKREEACKDFSAVKAILGITWFENFGRIICGW